jgi:DNA-binding GntR family transcriptional regulator
MAAPHASVPPRPSEGFRTKANLAYEHLREQIVNGTYAPGQRLTLADLSKHLGLSQVPVREALLRLEREGLLESEPHKGMRVMRLSLADAQELFEIRCELEALAAFRACCAREPDLAADLARINDAYARAFACGDYTRMGQANWDFHRRILHAAASGQLMRMLEDVWTRSFRFRLGYRLIPGRAEGTVAEHARIIDAFRACDPEAARAAARDHIIRAGADLHVTMNNTGTAEDIRTGTHPHVPTNDTEEG